VRLRGPTTTKEEEEEAITQFTKFFELLWPKPNEL